MNHLPLSDQVLLPGLLLSARLALAGSSHERWVKTVTCRPAGTNGDRSPAFHLPIGVAICGGFADAETALAPRPSNFTTNDRKTTNSLNP